MVRQECPLHSHAFHNTIAKLQVQIVCENRLVKPLPDNCESTWQAALTRREIVAYADKKWGVGYRHAFRQSGLPVVENGLF